MNHLSFDADRFDEYEELFDPTATSRAARRQRKPKARHIPKVDRDAALSEVADEVDLETDFDITYRPSQYEADWLVASLRPFYEETLITDVLALVRGGKEATVYCCEGHPSAPAPLLAAKVYRPRKFRSLRNDALYRQGRQILTADGRPVKNNEHRIMRAIGKKWPTASRWRRPRG